MAKDNIKTNPRLRLAGWRKAVKSPNTPPWLKKSMRKNIRDLEKRLRIKKVGTSRRDRILNGANKSASESFAAQGELGLTSAESLTRRH